MNDQLKQLIETDEKVISTKHFKVLRKDNDPTHFERRQQQRAISEELISLCLAYGEKKRIRGALTFTILDKNIKRTPYEKYLSDIRGLRVVLNKLADEEGVSELGIHTVYWVDSVRKK